MTNAIVMSGLAGYDPYPTPASASAVPRIGAFLLAAMSITHDRYFKSSDNLAVLVCKHLCRNAEMHDNNALQQCTSTMHFNKAGQGRLSQGTQQVKVARLLLKKVPSGGQSDLVAWTLHPGRPGKATLAI